MTLKCTAEHFLPLQSGSIDVVLPGVGKETQQVSSQKLTWILKYNNISSCGIKTRREN